MRDLFEYVTFHIVIWHKHTMELNWPSSHRELQFRSTLELSEDFTQWTYLNPSGRKRREKIRDTKVWQNNSFRWWMRSLKTFFSYLLFNSFIGSDESSVNWFQSSEKKDIACEVEIIIFWLSNVTVIGNNVNIVFVYSFQVLGRGLGELDSSGYTEEFNFTSTRVKVRNNFNSQCNWYRAESH